MRDRRPAAKRPPPGGAAHGRHSDDHARHLRELRSAIARLREMRTDAALSLVVGSRHAG